LKHKRLKQGETGINWLENTAKQREIYYRGAKSLQDKWKADTKMTKAIDQPPGNKVVTGKKLQAEKCLKFQLRLF